MTQDFMKELELVDRLSRTKISDDDLFAYAPRRAPTATARITCRVCERMAEQPIDTPGLLCGRCRGDLEKTELHIRQVLAAAELSFINAYDRLAASEAHADDETRRRYKNVEAHLGAAHEGTVDPASVRRRYEAAKAKGDGLGVLLREKEAAEGIALEYQRKQKWAEMGLREVEAAR